MTAAEPIIRLGCFAGVLLLMVAWELLAPRRPQAIKWLLRWPNNLGLVVLNTFVVRLLFPLAGVGMAFPAQSKGWASSTSSRRQPGSQSPARCFCSIWRSTGST